MVLNNTMRQGRRPYDESGLCFVRLASHLSRPSAAHTPQVPAHAGSHPYVQYHVSTYCTYTRSLKIWIRPEANIRSLSPGRVPLLSASHLSYYARSQEQKNIMGGFFSNRGSNLCDNFKASHVSCITSTAEFRICPADQTQKRRAGVGPYRCTGAKGVKAQYF